MFNNDCNKNKNSMLYMALAATAAALLLFWLFRSGMFRRGHTNTAVVTTSTANGKTVVPSAVATTASTVENKPATDEFLKAYVTTPANKIYSAYDSRKKSLFVFDYPGVKTEAGLAPHAIALQDRNAENFHTNPAAFVILQKDVMLPVVKSSPSYRDKFSFMTMLDSNANFAGVLTPQGITLYDATKTVDALKAGDTNSVKVLWNVSMDALKAANTKTAFVAPTKFKWDGNEGAIELEVGEKTTVLIKPDGTTVLK